MARWSGLVALLMAGALASCATGDPRLQGTWKSNKVPMPTEMVKVKKMETVRVRKGSRRTKKIPKTVLVARPKPAPPYIDLLLTYDRSNLTIKFLSDGPKARGVTIPYRVAASDENSVTISLRDPRSGELELIEIVFDGPNRFWVQPYGGDGWKEYYERVAMRG